MSLDAGRAFLPTLREIERQLHVPVPERVRILRELEFDLERLRARYLADGFTADEARSRALAALVPEGGALEELGALHAPTYALLTERLDAERLRLVERAALATLTLAVMLTATGALLRLDLLGDPSPFLWPVLVSAAALVAASGTACFEMFVVRDHTRVRSSLAVILGASATTLVVGAAGAVFELYRLAGVMEAAPPDGVAIATRWLAQSAALLVVSILAALVGGLTWLVLTQVHAAVEAARHDLLGFKVDRKNQEE